MSIYLEGWGNDFLVRILRIIDIIHWRAPRVSQLNLMLIRGPLKARVDTYFRSRAILRKYLSRGPHFSKKAIFKLKKWPLQAICGPRTVCCPLLHHQGLSTTLNSTTYIDAIADRVDSIFKQTYLATLFEASYHDKNIFKNIAHRWLKVYNNNFLTTCAVDVSNSTQSS